LNVRTCGALASSQATHPLFAAPIVAVRPFAISRPPARLPGSIAVPCISHKFAKSQKKSMSGRDYDFDFLELIYADNIIHFRQTRKGTGVDMHTSFSFSTGFLVVGVPSRPSRPHPVWPNGTQHATGRD